MAAVKRGRVMMASKTIANADIIAIACRNAGLAFYIALALMEKESGGRNVYGHDKGGALAGFPMDVNFGNFQVFEWMLNKGATSNGVGPGQITYKGYFPEMKKQGLKCWDPHDNMLFAFRILKANLDRTGNLAKAGAQYNGGPNPNATARAYGDDLAAKAKKWKKTLATI